MNPLRKNSAIPRYIVAQTTKRALLDISWIAIQIVKKSFNKAVSPNFPTHFQRSLSFETFIFEFSVGNIFYLSHFTYLGSSVDNIVKNNRFQHTWIGFQTS
jgi:hypothetical protein